MSESADGSRRTWERWLPLTSVAAVVLWILAIVFDPGTPDLFVATGQEWQTFVTDNAGGIQVSRMVLLLGDLLFILFIGTLRTRLVMAEGQPALWASVATGSGFATAVMLIGTSTPVLAASTVSGIEPASAQALGVVEYAFFVGAEVTGAALLSATGVLAIRTRVLPAWLGWASFGIALLMLLIVVGPLGFIGIALGLPLWVLSVSIVLALGGKRNLAD